MDDTLPMCVRERPGDVAEDTRCFGGRQRPAAPHSLGQGLALDVCHGKEHESADLFDGVNRNDVGVGELGGGTRLTQEPFAEFRIGCLRGRQQLDRDGPVQPHLSREIHDPHPAAPQLALQRIATCDGRLKVEKQAVWLLHEPYSNERGSRRGLEPLPQDRDDVGGGP